MRAFVAPSMLPAIARDKAGTTVFDLDWRPMFWRDPDQARPYYREALRHDDQRHN